MRRCYLVSYDISHPKRLRRTFKLLRGYGQHWQYSIFFCVLKEIDRVRLQTDLENEINQKEDQVLIIDLGKDEDKARQSVVTLGTSSPAQEERVVVI